MSKLVRSLVGAFGFQSLNILQALAVILLSAAMLSGLWLFVYLVFSMGSMINGV